MTNDWRFVWTPQFLFGTLIAGLLLNVVAAYAVRAIDRLGKVLPAFYRRARDEESSRIEQLTTAATSDNALYAALAAEASRLRLLQLLGFVIAFVFTFTVLVLVTVSQSSPVAKLTTTVLVLIVIVVTFLSVGGCFSLRFRIGER